LAIMHGFASAALLLVAAGLLVLVLVGARGRCGRPPSSEQGLAMALMTGLATGYLALVSLGHPLMFFPLGVAAVLVVSWLRVARLADAGSLLLGWGALWTTMFAWQLLNDLSDPAVSYPGWTPYPLAAGAAMVILGLALLLGSLIGMFTR
jgi:hypothetical protein